MTSNASLIALSQWAILKLDREDDEIPDVFGDLGEIPIFAITAY